MNNNRKKPKSILRSILLLILASLLIPLCYPEYDYGCLAWIAITPLILSCQGLSVAQTFLFGLVWGNLTNLLIFKWLFVLPGFGVVQTLPLSFYLGLYGALWCLCFSIFNNRRILWYIGGSVSWVLLEYIRHHAGFMSLPWLSLAHSQHNNIVLIQTAAISGEYGISFFIILANIALADFILNKKYLRFVSVIGIVSLVHLGGYIYLNLQDSMPTVKTALVQPCIFRSERVNQEAIQRTLDRLIFYSERAALHNPAIIAWPETAIRDPLNNKLLYDRILDLVSRIKIPILFGASEFAKFSVKPDNQLNETTTLTIKKKFYNSAMFLKPNSTIVEPYRKILLVPFAEYLPLSEYFTWPKWLIPGHFGVTAGDRFQRYTIKNNITICPIICWENLFSSFVRQNVNVGCDIIIQLTNAIWFETTEASQQHNIASVFRAVENHRPVLVVSNSGPSIAVDQHGRVVAAKSGLFEEGILIVDVELYTNKTLYTKYGDWFVLVCLILFVFLSYRVILSKIKKISNEQD